MSKSSHHHSVTTILNEDTDNESDDYFSEGQPLKDLDVLHLYMSKIDIDESCFHTEEKENHQSIENHRSDKNYDDSKDLSLDEFRKELDLITKPLDEMMNLDDLLEAAKLRHAVFKVKEESARGLYAESNIQNEELKTDRLSSDPSPPSRIIPMHNTPSRVNRRSVMEPRNVNSSSFDFSLPPPTPVKTPLYSSIKQNQRRKDTHSTPDQASIGLVKGMKDLKTYDTDSICYKLNESIIAPHSIDSTAPDPVSTPDNLSIKSFRYGRDEKFTASSVQSSSTKKSDNGKSILDSMYDALERQDDQIRKLEDENSILRKKLRQHEKLISQLRTSDTRTSLISPPPITSTLRTQEAISPFSQSSNNHHRRETSGSHSTSKPARETIIGDPTYSGNKNHTKQENMTSHEEFFNAYQYSKRNRTENQHENDKKLIEYSMIDPENPDLEEQLLDENLFSPGTRFVEALSRVVEIKEGHFGPLSLIMDKHFDKLSNHRHQNS